MQDLKNIDYRRMLKLLEPNQKVLMFNAAE